MTTIRFARISFERKLPHFSDPRDAIQRRKETLREVIDYSTDVNKLLKGTKRSGLRKRGDWYYGDVKTGNSYLAARLGKQTEQKSKEPDDEIEGFREVERDDTFVSLFVIDLRTSVMAYEFKKDIGRKAPFRILEAVFNSYYDGEEEISISPIVDKEEIREELETLTRITGIHFTGLKLPNPDSTDSSRSMHEFLRDSGIDNLQLDGRSDDDDEEEGIRLEEDPILDGGMNLAEEGYGKATVEGEDQFGDHKTVTTDEKPIESFAMFEDDDDTDIKTLRAEIRRMLERLEQ